ncbi:MAG: epoxyqueuosine reductase [Desulfobacterales bacterium]|nr:epoxyqueuosine reductase [Desulfobacterales bacterium]
MTLNDKGLSGDLIIEKSLEFGACLAGIANVEELKQSPSHNVSEKISMYIGGGVGTKTVKGVKLGEVKWPAAAKSAVVIAVEHPADAPDMDWWLKGLKGGTKGNARLMAVFSKLAEWLEQEEKIKYIKIPYHIEHGGIFMKDAAVSGGLGCVGKNNILVTPQYGSRIRLRVMLLEEDLPSTGVIDFDPCEDCKEYCRKVCPEKAFDEKLYSAEEYGQEELPGRTGVYSRMKCNLQMEKNAADGKEVEIEDTGKKGHEVRHCRLCEQACPVGRS